MAYRDILQREFAPHAFVFAIAIVEFEDAYPKNPSQRGREVKLASRYPAMSRCYKPRLNLDYYRLTSAKSSQKWMFFLSPTGRSAVKELLRSGYETVTVAPLVRELPDPHN